MNVSVAVQTDHGLMVPVVKVIWVKLEYLNITRFAAIDLFSRCI